MASRGPRDRRLGGKKRQLSPIGKSVSVSFRVRVVRACVRAKLCERGREVLLNAGGSNGKKFDSGVDLAFCAFVIIRLGFKEKKLQKLRKAVGFLNIILYSLLFAWVLWKLLDANPYFVAIRIGFERILEMLSLQL